MNERIKKLAEQANIHFSRVGILDGDPNGSARMVGYSKMEKFAELIVKETISVLQKRFMGDLNREDMEVRRCIADIQKHFGVEE
jgi:hypothetical protein